MIIFRLLFVCFPLLPWMSESSIILSSVSSYFELDKIEKHTRLPINTKFMKVLV